MLTWEQIQNIGSEAGLQNDHLNLFADYIVARGFDTKDPMYIKDWAMRFLKGREWECSDGKGRKLLVKVIMNRFFSEDLGIGENYGN